MHSPDTRSFPVKLGANLTEGSSNLKCMFNKCFLKSYGRLNFPERCLQVSLGKTQRNLPTSSWIRIWRLMSRLMNRSQTEHVEPFILFFFLPRGAFLSPFFSIPEPSKSRSSAANMGAEAERSKPGRRSNFIYEFSFSCKGCCEGGIGNSC